MSELALTILPETAADAPAIDRLHEVREAVTDPSDSTICGPTTDADQVCTLTADGSQTIVIADSSGTETGDYTVQAVLNRYETFHRADGSVVTLAPDKGEGQDWTKKPGNLYSTPVRLHIDPAHPQPATAEEVLAR